MDTPLNLSLLSSFSEDFITINADIPVEYAVSVVSRTNPEYLIVNRLKDQTHYRYVFSIKQFLHSVDNAIKNDNLKELKESLEKFLDLHEYKSDKVAEVTDEDMNNAQLLEPLSQYDKLVILEWKGQAVGVIDPGRSGKREISRPTESEWRGGDAILPGDPDGEPIGSPPPAVQIQVIQRYSYVMFPAQMELEETAPLEVGIKVEQPPASTSATKKIELPVDLNEKEIPVMVILDLGTFEIDKNEKYYTKLLVPVEAKDSSLVIFHLTAKKEGWQTIAIRFYYQQTGVGELKIHTMVVPQQQLKDSSTSSHGSQIKRSGGELNLLDVPPGTDITLYIHEKRVTPDFEYDVLLTSKQDPLIVIGPINFPFNPEKKFRDIFERIEKDNSPNNVVDQRIKKLGENLYEELFPAALKDLYWQKRDEKKLESIRIISKEPWIPWEIIKPWRQLSEGNIEEDAFLCEQYSFARWLVNTPERIKNEQLKKVNVVVPSDTNLPNARKERDWIIDQFRNIMGLDVSVDSKYEDVISTLEIGGFDLLHFSTHGIYKAENPLFSSIQLENQIDFTSADIAGKTRRFGYNNPLVILNACQTGAQGFSLTGIQSWATKFLNSGARVFIGTMWSVSDDIAFKFAQEFYTELFKGTTLGEAVQIARNKSKRSGDPSWLAYQLYGHPNLQIKFGSK
ncbi:MAG TPA: CHAT domain-containing protein [Nitrososphaeraceae archaeon]|nr:CHAT domain-containing protein [Nitrososphaeraceae archaeon]